jgi:hypothetical protein
MFRSLLKVAIAYNYFLIRTVPDLGGLCQCASSHVGRLDFYSKIGV